MESNKTSWYVFMYTYKCRHIALCFAKCVSFPTEKMNFDIFPEPEVYHFRISHTEELFINKHTWKFWNGCFMLYNEWNYCVGTWQNNSTRRAFCCIWKGINFYMNYNFLNPTFPMSLMPDYAIFWIWIWILVFLRHFQQYFSYIMATSFSGGRSWSTLREPPTTGKLYHLRVHPFFVIYKGEREPTPYWWPACMSC